MTEVPAGKVARPLRAFVVGGKTAWAQENLAPTLLQYAIEMKWHCDMDSRNAGDLPKQAEIAVVFYEMCSGSLSSQVAAQAKRRGIPVLKPSRKKSEMELYLSRNGYPKPVIEDAPAPEPPPDTALAQAIDRAQQRGREREREMRVEMRAPASVAPTPAPAVRTPPTNDKVRKLALDKRLENIAAARVTLHPSATWDEVVGPDSDRYSAADRRARLLAVFEAFTTPWTLADFWRAFAAHKPRYRENLGINGREMPSSEYGLLSNDIRTLREEEWLVEVGRGHAGETRMLHLAHVTAPTASAAPTPVQPPAPPATPSTIRKEPMMSQNPHNGTAVPIRPPGSAARPVDDSARERELVRLAGAIAELMDTFTDVRITAVLVERKGGKIALTMRKARMVEDDSVFDLGGAGK